ncbi:MAG: MgtC/SapB family protein [Enterocloster asparagiformis]|nr:MgtC/SapB family protein [Enterocloster asparagiformis]
MEELLIWEEITELRELNSLSVFVRLMLSMTLGGVLGVEREQKRRPAGFRTYVIVCLGSTLVMMTNQYAHLYMGAPDPTRIAAQVVSGIGFLGAGTILVTKNNQVRGLTTAAGLWAAAALGLAIGCGFYSGAIMSFLAILISIKVLHTVDHLIYRKSPVVSLYAELDNIKSVSFFLSYAREHGMALGDLEITKQKQMSGGGVCIRGTIRMEQRKPHDVIIQEFGQLPGVSYVEELR